MASTSRDTGRVLHLVAPTDFDVDEWNFIMDTQASIATTTTTTIANERMVASSLTSEESTSDDDEDDGSKTDDGADGKPVSKKKYRYTLQCIKCHDVRESTGSSLPNIHVAYKSRRFCTGWPHVHHKYRIQKYVENDKKPVGVVRPFSVCIQ